MKKLKSLMAILLAALVLCSAFAGCAKEDNNADVSATDVATAQPHASANGIMTVDDGVMRTELTSVELTHLMGNGINLGNTMEACNNNTGHVTDDTTYYETMWGCPVTTQEMISAMKAAGFNTLRLPVAWMTNATDLATKGDYTISEEYFNRVEEIMNYCFNEGMYVVLNDHWDGGWYGMFGSEDESTRELAMEAYKSMWTQISNRYAEYSDYLIFEGANEEIGARFDENSPIYCSDSTDSYLSEDETFELANEINQVFVDTVRATGGNNAERFLLIPGYGTEITRTIDDRFVMPTDTAKNKLLISVHYYEPSGFCIFESISNWGTKAHYTTMIENLDKMGQFVADGYGVVIGECGAIVIVDNELKEGALDWTEFFLDNCDSWGYCPILWDTNSAFDRKNGEFKFDDLAQIFVSHSLASQSDMTADELQSAALKEVNDTYNSIPEDEVVYCADDQSIAWIMYTSNDWCVQYSVGDTYSPVTATTGTVATDVEITGEGTYTVALDFTGVSGGYATGCAFSALGIANGELLYPGYSVVIKELKINGVAYDNLGKYYTSSDDEKCTRVNLYNGWVPTPDGDNLRRADGDITDITAMPWMPDDLATVQVKTVELTFEYVAPAE